MKDIRDVIGKVEDFTFKNGLSVLFWWLKIQLWWMLFKWIFGFIALYVLLQLFLGGADLILALGEWCREGNRC